MSYSNPVESKALPYIARSNTALGNVVANQKAEKPTQGGFLMKTLDLLQRGNYASANVMKDLIDGNGFTPFKSAWQGVTGKDKTLYSDVLNEAGVQNKWVKGGLGFAMDVLLDPVTYMTFGAGGAVKIGGKALNVAGKALLKKSSSKYGARAGSEMMQTMMKSAGGIEKYAAKGGIKFAGKQILDTGKWSKQFGLDKVGKAVKDTSLGKWIGSAFIPNYRPPEINAKDWKKIVDFKKVYNESVHKGSQDVLDYTFRISRKFSNKERGIMADALRRSNSGVPVETALKKLYPKASEDMVQSTKHLQGSFKRMWSQENQRGLIKSFKDGYVPGIYKKKNGQFSRWSKPKVFSNPEEAAEAGYDLIGGGDVAKLYGVRGVSSARLTATKDFYEQMSNAFALKKGDLGFDFATKVNTNFLGARVFDKSIAKEINKFTGAFTDESIGGFLKNYDKALNMWKGSVTTMFPSFHSRNFLSNTWLMHLGGVNPIQLPHRMSQAIDVQKYARAVKMGDNATVAKLGSKKIGNYSIDEVFQRVKDTQVMNGGWYGMEVSGEEVGTKIAQTLGVNSKTEKVARKIANPIRSGREVGTMVENNARIGLFIDQLEKGNHWADAAQHAKKYLFDYGDLTTFEKSVMKRTIPFYTWMRKNIPLQLESIIKEPGKFTGIEKLRQETNKLSEDEAGSEKYLPEWIGNQFSVRLPFKKKDGKDLYVSPDLAFQDLATFTNIEEYIGSINPIVKAGFEYAANYDFFRKRELVDKNLPPGEASFEKIKQIIKNNLRAGQTLSSLTSDQKGTLDKIIRHIFGMYVYQYSPSESKKWMKYEEKMQERASEKSAKEREKMSNIERWLK